MSQHICRYCDEPISDPADAVAVLHEISNSGPGWTVWAHREHVHLVEIANPDLMRIMTRIWTARFKAARDS